MAYEIATVTNSGGNYAHQNFLAALKVLAEANGWTTLRYVNTGANWEWIGVGEGFSTEDEIYVGFQTYENVGADYYNINQFTGVGYISGNTFIAQPGAQYTSTPMHNTSILYFLSINPQRIIYGAKLASLVYTFGGGGKFWSYMRPTEYPLPVFAAGMRDVNSTTRFDNSVLIMPWKGYFVSTETRLYVRDLNGGFGRPWCYPYLNKSSQVNEIGGNQGVYTLVPAGDYYQIEPIIIAAADDTNNPSIVWGEIDGVFFVSGFSNSSENVIQIGGDSVVDQTGMTTAAAVAAILTVNGRAFVVLQDAYRNSWRDFICIEMKED